MKAAILGFATIGVLVIALAWLVPDDQVRRPMWLFVYLALVACCWFSWRHPKAPNTPAGWLQYFCGVLLACGALAAIDAIVYGIKSGHILLDSALCALGGIVTISGAAYSWAANQKNDG